MSGETDDADRVAIGLAAEEIRQETAAISTLLSQYASKADVERQLLAERKKTKELVEERDRWRNRLLAAVVVGVAVVFILALWAVNLSRAVKHEADSRERDRVTTAAASCESANISRGQINAGNEAKTAILKADRKIQDEIDALLAPIEIAPPSADRDAYLQIFHDSRAQVQDAQKVADEKIAAAFLKQRDCSRPSDPAATLNTPATTAPTVTPATTAPTVTTQPGG